MPTLVVEPSSFFLGCLVADFLGVFIFFTIPKPLHFAIICITTIIWYIKFFKMFPSIYAILFKEGVNTISIPSPPASSYLEEVPNLLLLNPAMTQSCCHRLLSQHQPPASPYSNHLFLQRNYLPFVFANEC